MRIGHPTYRLTSDVGTLTSQGQSATLTYSGASSNITPSLEVEYVDSSGVRQRTQVVDGVTSISGVAPFLVHFDASGTRSVETDGDDERGGFLGIGYHINFGEALGTTYSYPESTSDSQDEEYGPPIFARAFRNVGTNTVVLTCRDSAGNEADISLDVVVAASSTLTTTNISTGGAGWPTFESSRRYTLNRGSDYTSYGTIDTSGLHNVLFEATGAGADPIISGISFDSQEGDEGGARTRAKHVRTREIDVGVVSFGPVGIDFCGVVEGRARQYTSGSQGWYWDVYRNQANQTRCDNIKYPRGLFFIDCGEMVTRTGTLYVMIDSIRALHARNVKFNHTVTSDDEHNLRLPVSAFSSFRNCLITCESSSMVHRSWIKGNGAVTLRDEAIAWDADDDFLGDYDLGTVDGNTNDLLNEGYIGHPSYKSFFHRCQFGNAAGTTPGTPCGWGPQNNDDDGTHESCHLCGFEDCVLYGTPTFSSQSTFNYTGLDLFHRNIRVNMGAGAYVASATGAGNIKTATGYNTGYLTEDANTRPVPSTL